MLKDKKGLLKKGLKKRKMFTGSNLSYNQSPQVALTAKMTIDYIMIGMHI